MLRQLRFNGPVLTKLRNGVFTVSKPTSAIHRAVFYTVVSELTTFNLWVQHCCQIISDRCFHMCTANENISLG